VSQSKIFGIGLSRTGTTSLTLALETLGNRVIHFPMTTKEIEEHDAATDTPVAANFEALDARFPGAKFIYTTREISEWLESCRRFWTKRKESSFDPTPFITNLHRKLYGSPEFNPDGFAQAYQRHEAQVLGFFADRPSDLLVLDICGGSIGWEPLCDFLGASIPNIPFPSVNASSAIDQVLLRLLHAIEDSKRICQLSGVPEQYLEELRSSQAFRDHDPQSSMDLGESWELHSMLAAACSHFGGADMAARKLNLPKARLTEILGRNRRL
jgi:hypothetical protein